MKSHFLTIIFSFFLGLGYASAQEITLMKPAEAVSKLKIRQANRVDITLPSKIKWADVRFESEGATIVKNEERGSLLITPTQSTIAIKVYEKDELLQTLNYKSSFPVLQVQTATVSALYANCGNELKFNVIEDGEYYKDLTFKSADAQITQGESNHYLTVIPNANTTSVKVEVYASNSLLATETFKVRHVPQPELVVYLGDYPVSLQEGIYITKPISEKLMLKAIPEITFASFLPKDARYRVERYTILLARGGRVISNLEVKGSEGADLNSFLANAQSGDRLVLETKEVVRMNALNKVEPVSNMRGNIFVIPLK